MIRIVVAIYLTTATAAAAAAQIAALPASGNGTLNVRADDKFAQQVVIAVENTTSAMLDRLFARGSLEGQSLASLAIQYSELPFVDTQVSVSQRNSISTTSSFVQASASGLLRFDARVLIKQPPPFDPEGVTVTLTVPYALSDFGTEDSNASVSMRVLDFNEEEIFDETRVMGVDSNEGIFRVKGPIEVLLAYEITIEAIVSANASQIEARDVLQQSEAQAIIGVTDFSIPRASPGSAAARTLTAMAPTPLLAFDQEAFDEIYGPNSFELEEFYEFEFSPSIVPIPVPGSAALLACGLLSLTLRRLSPDRLIRSCQH